MITCDLVLIIFCIPQVKTVFRDVDDIIIATSTDSARYTLIRSPKLKL